MSPPCPHVMAGVEGVKVKGVGGGIECVRESSEPKAARAARILVVIIFFAGVMRYSSWVSLFSAPKVQGQDQAFVTHTHTA